MSVLVSSITDAEFQAAVAQGVTLVDFWAPWCGPCKMIAPTLDELAGELQGRARIAKINLDDNPEVAQAFGVMSIPTLLLFKDGQPVGKLVGAQPKASLRAFVEQAF
jgi:thioredoxin 1